MDIPSTSNAPSTLPLLVEDSIGQQRLPPNSKNSTAAKIDDPVMFVEFLLEDLELLLVHTDSNSIAMERMQLVMSLCEDLKFIRSFLKTIPEIFSENIPNVIEFDLISPLIQSNENFEAQETSSVILLNGMAKQVKSIQKNILDIYNDSFCTCSGIPRVAEIEVVVGDGEQKSTLIKRLAGGPKDLEIIFTVGMTDYDASVYYHPLIINHFPIRQQVFTSESEPKIRKWIKKNLGFLLGRKNLGFLLGRKNLGFLLGRKNSVRRVNGAEGMYRNLREQRFFIEISELFGFFDWKVWDDLKMYFPNDGNGSKIIVRSSINTPLYLNGKRWKENSLYLFPDEERAAEGFRVNELKEIKRVREVDTKKRGALFCIKVRNIAFKLFQSPELLILAEKINSIKKKVEQVCEDGFPTKCAQEGNLVLQTVHRESSSSIAGEEIIVGFEDEALALRDRLTRQNKQLEVISIVGMAGIGKTTMAKRLFNDLHVACHFHIRGWTFASQVCHKGNLLRKLLLHLIDDKDSLSDMNDEAMGETLFRYLKGKRYLIVVDDIWDSKVWNDLRIYFPNDENGSKILITSRIKDVVFNPKGNCPPHCLRFLNQEESWDLFRRKVLANESCPEELMEIGQKIVAKCKGLPLAIVVVSGIISKKEKKSEWWWHIAENIGSYIDRDAEQLMYILELSYNYLPHRLKSCFLYLGAFPEDYEISVRKLIRMWIAEGFIEQNEGKRLEDVAENDLRNLIDRSLVTVSKRGSDGGIKTCRLHDLLRDLCIKKARENNFLLPNYGYQANSSPFTSLFLNCFYCHNAFSSTHCQANCKEFPRYPFDYVPMGWVFCKQSVSFIYNPLRVLDLKRIILPHFPHAILQLIRLKYLALCIHSIASLPQNIYELWNLETLIVDVVKGKNVTLPDSIWNMVKLRHLHVSPELKFETPRSSLSMEHVLECRCSSYASSLVLENLQTISWLCPLGSTRNLLARTPNVRNLGFHLTLSSCEDPFYFFDLSNLNMLEKLKFEYQTFGMVPVTLSNPDVFPSSLRKLTLIGSHVNWEEMSIVGMLPNLEVLKVKDNFFSGPTWETSEGGFRRLKFLSFSHLDLQEWTASTDIFPSLERLVLNGCLDLAEIPSVIGDICSLQSIEIYRSSESVIHSAWQIQELQRSFGNDELKVFIYHHCQDNISL